METTKISHDTRHQRVDAMRNDTMHLAHTRGPVRPGRRFLTACGVVLLIGVGFILARLSGGGGPAATPAPTTSPSDTAVMPRQNVLLVEDPVCGKPVNPSRTRFVLKFNGQDLYFDSEECMARFLADPFKYGRLRLKVTVTRPDGTSTTVPVPSGVDPSGLPVQVTPTAQASTAPGGEGGLELPPESSPDTGSEPPPVAEPRPAKTSAPEQSAPGPDTGAPPAPSASESPDDGNFTLPPNLDTPEESTRKPAAKPAAKPSKPAAPAAKRAPKAGRTAPPPSAPSTGDDPPSVEDPGGM